MLISELIRLILVACRPFPAARPEAASSLTVRVTVGGLIGPLAAVGGRGEGEPCGTVHAEGEAVDAVVEVAALSSVPGAEVAPLMGAELGGLCGLCGGRKNFLVLAQAQPNLKCTGHRSPLVLNNSNT